MVTVGKFYNSDPKIHFLQIYRKFIKRIHHSGEYNGSVRYKDIHDIFGIGILIYCPTEAFMFGYVIHGSEGRKMKIQMNITAIITKMYQLMLSVWNFTITITRLFHGLKFSSDIKTSKIK